MDFFGGGGRAGCLFTFFTFVHILLMTLSSLVITSNITRMKHIQNNQKSIGNPYQPIYKVIAIALKISTKNNSTIKSLETFAKCL